MNEKRKNRNRTILQINWFVKVVCINYYLHPTENCEKYEDIKPLGFGSRIGFKSRYGFWNEVSMDNGLNYRRNDYDSLIDDTSQVECNSKIIWYKD